MAFIERHANHDVDPVIAFMHDDRNPFDAVVDISGQIVPAGQEHKSFGPPLPVVLMDAKTGAERMISEGEEIVVFEPKKENKVNHSKTPLSIRKLASFIPNILG